MKFYISNKKRKIFFKLVNKLISKKDNILVRYVFIRDNYAYWTNGFIVIRTPFFHADETLISAKYFWGKRLAINGFYKTLKKNQHTIFFDNKFGTIKKVFINKNDFNILEETNFVYQIYEIQTKICGISFKMDINKYEKIARYYKPTKYYVIEIGNQKIIKFEKYNDIEVAIFPIRTILDYKKQEKEILTADDL